MPGPVWVPGGQRIRRGWGRGQSEGGQEASGSHVAVKAVLYCSASLKSSPGRTT